MGVAAHRSRSEVSGEGGGEGDCKGGGEGSGEASGERAFDRGSTPTVRTGTRGSAA